MSKIFEFVFIYFRDQDKELIEECSLEGIEIIRRDLDIKINYKLKKYDEPEYYTQMELLDYGKELNIKTPRVIFDHKGTSGLAPKSSLYGSKAVAIVGLMINKKNQNNKLIKCLVHEVLHIFSSSHHNLTLGIMNSHDPKCLLRIYEGAKKEIYDFMEVN